MLVSTALANVGLTVAIAGRVWYQYRQMARTMHRNTEESLHVRVMWLIVESGFLIAVAQLLVLVLGILDNPGYQIVVHAVNPLIVRAPAFFFTICFAYRNCTMKGVVFTGVIVRVQVASNASRFASGESAPLDTIVLHSAMGTHIRSGDPSSLSRRHISLDTKSPHHTTVKRLESHDTSSGHVNGGYTEELELTPFK